MDKMYTVEERIRRASEIYDRRNRETVRSQTVKKELKNEGVKTKFKLIKKLLNQIVICAVIYIAMYMIQNNGYVFTDEVLEKVNEVLGRNMSFMQIYEGIKNQYVQIEEVEDTNIIIEKEEEPKEVVEEEQIGGIGGAEYIEEEKEEIEEVIEEKPTYIIPYVGQTTSKFGIRDTSLNIPKNHTGIDLAGKIGDKIISSTDGEVVLVSEEGDYGKHVKIQLGEISLIYAHCNEIYVSTGQYVNQGEEIAELGNTGNSTGPHLHFEIRVNNIPVDPEEFLTF